MNLFEVGDTINIGNDENPLVMEITEIKEFSPRHLYQMKPVPPTVDWPFEGAAYFEAELVRFGAKIWK
jgi:hypothetical protein